MYVEQNRQARELLDNAIESRKLRELYEEVKKKLDVGSYFAYVEIGGTEKPVYRRA